MFTAVPCFTLLQESYNNSVKTRWRLLQTCNLHERDPFTRSELSMDSNVPRCIKNSWRKLVNYSTIILYQWWRFWAHSQDETFPYARTDCIKAPDEEQISGSEPMVLLKHWLPVSLYVCPVQISNVARYRIRCGDPHSFTYVVLNFFQITIIQREKKEVANG